MGEITQEIFDDFVNRFSVYLANANESKKRGNNDYNPLKAVQNLYDEVNMHSGFLHSLLDTNGEHYQDDLFLRLFLEVLNLKKWFGETKNAQVLKEHKNIDIYISNGENRIIIENKIWADDQKEQIARYIETIHDENSNENVNYENIAVVYLSPFSKEPSQNSLDKWQINNDMLKCGNDKVLYRQISYEKEILEWIEKCQSKDGVGNITSLNSALEFYKDIIEIIIGQKDSKMDIVGFFKEQKDFEIAFEIYKNEIEIMNAYLGNIKDDIQKDIGNSWQVEYDKNGYLYVFSEQYGDEMAFLFDIESYIERNKKKFRCWFYLEWHNIETEKYKQKLQKYLSQELNEVELKRYENKQWDLDFIYIDYLDIYECLKAKEIFMEFIKKYEDLANKLNEKLKDFKI